MTATASAQQYTTARYAALSIAAALVTIALKTVAWRLTDSVGLLADALESLVNLAAAMFSFWMLLVAARPPSGEFDFGYSKAEYFASGFEGTLILLASVAIGYEAVDRLLAPQPLGAIGVGLVVSTVASLVNFGVARVLLSASEAHNSIALEADARHLMTDVWTSVGVVIAVGAVALTGWAILDPLIAIAVAVNILWVAFGLVRRSVSGLLDRALSPQAVDAIRAVLEKYRLQGADYHALRTRQAAGRSFVAVHVLVPPSWTVQRGHALLEDVEADIRAVVPGASVMTHLEPIGDPASYADIELDREEGGTGEVCLLRNGRSQTGR